jgi:hypothetical protein
VRPSDEDRRTLIVDGGSGGLINAPLAFVNEALYVGVVNIVSY